MCVCFCTQSGGVSPFRQTVPSCDCSIAACTCTWYIFSIDYLCALTSTSPLLFIFVCFWCKGLLTAGLYRKSASPVSLKRLRTELSSAGKDYQYPRLLQQSLSWILNAEAISDLTFWKSTYWAIFKCCIVQIQITSLKWGCPHHALSSVIKVFWCVHCLVLLYSVLVSGCIQLKEKKYTCTSGTVCADVLDLCVLILLTWLSLGNNTLDLADFDGHVLGGAIKTFLRELGEPTIPENMYKSFLESAGRSYGMSRLLKWKSHFLSPLLKCLLQVYVMVVNHRSRQQLSVCQSANHNGCFITY